MSSEPETRIQARHPIRKGPIYALSLPRGGVAPDLASSRPEDTPATATEEEVLARLALWLADVAADAAAVASQTRGEADEPPVGEPAR